MTALIIRHTATSGSSRIVMLPLTAAAARPLQVLRAEQADHLRAVAATADR